MTFCHGVGIVRAACEYRKGVDEAGMCGDMIVVSFCEVARAINSAIARGSWQSRLRQRALANHEFSREVGTHNKSRHELILRV